MNECKVCGSTKTNLVDGFYYCTECGTQDDTIRETAIEEVFDDHGRMVISGIKSLKKRNKDKHDDILMNPEWVKWNTYNFLVPHMTEQLIQLGAEPTLKEKVLWVWTRYIKKFWNKHSYYKNIAVKSNTLLEEDSSSDEDFQETENDSRTTDRGYESINPFTFRVLIAILHVGLNLDNSDILLSHLIRFIREGRLDFTSSLDALPQDLYKRADKRMIASALESQTYVLTNGIHNLARKLFIELELGPPIQPNLNTILTNQIKELCLPNEFIKLVLSIMNYGREKKDPRFHIKRLNNFHNYELVVMSYIMIALKMCFGLDGVYEYDISKAIDKINDDEQHLKCYNLGVDNEEVNRLFSFKNWLNFLDLRRSFLCKYHQPTATYNDVDRDGRIAVDGFKNMSRNNTKKSMRQNMMSEIIEELPLPKIDFINRETFPITRTPLSDYNEFIISQIDDPGTRLALSEDFTKYSLKYACYDIFLTHNNGEKELLTGVSDSYKVIKDNLYLTKESVIDESTVFVKHTDDKDWAKNIKDVMYLEELKDDSNLESSTDEIPVEEQILETIEELTHDKNIYGDIGSNFDSFLNQNSLGSDNVSDYNTEFQRDDSKDVVVPADFNREEAIKEFILQECRILSIKPPRKYGDPLKFKTRTVPPHERNVNSGERTNTRNKYKELLKSYYETCFQQELNKTKEDLGLTINETILNESIFPDNDVISDDFNIDNLSTGIPEQNNEENNFDFENYQDLDADQLLQLIEQKSDLNDLVNKQFYVIEADNKRKTGRKKKPVEISSDDEPLSVIKERENQKCILAKLSKKQSKRKLPFLINPAVRTNLSHYNYYERQYTDLYSGANNRSFLFEVELFNSLPKSFCLVLKHCASVIELDQFTVFVKFCDKESKLLIASKSLLKRRELYKKSREGIEKYKRKAPKNKKHKRKKRKVDCGQ